MQTVNGDSIEIVSLLPRPGPAERVYNLEVNGERVYYVGDTCVLVHNEYVKLRHYRYRRGLNGIRSEGVIVASDQNKVFAELARGRPKSPRVVEETYGIARGRGRDYVEFCVDADRVSRVKNSSTGNCELGTRNNR